ncbi:site-specific DNA-methyltransferase [Rhabdobacter roseus]|uniref:site-specific DNA-methyltransferase (adenine-specific) n=1 Tax=Rhabdobacter roseus TaxID=1655419 RepID=A0A840TSX6_9BACT|nr:site-specific DNA-methyltransferase [Rhabdobacter roseus]MBB5287051.1 adenine-specific DNA-methyltransferase [Rhabdobacter roseus]
MPTLHWIGKDKVVNHHLDVPYRVLNHEYGFTAAEGGTPSPTRSGNKIIHGDNLEALKALLPEYEGRVKCIYIDPPYNTGNEGWVYNDNVNDPKIKKWLATVVGKEGEDLSRHDKWLCMMYPRLKLLHKLMADDGAIFISIDDNEQSNLKLVCDEIFGYNNFIINILWQKKYTVANDHKTVAPMHEYVMLYQKSSNWNRNLLPRNEENDKQYKFEDEKGIFRSSDYTCNKSADERPNLYYPVTNPNTGLEIWPKKTRVWAYSREENQRHLDENLIYWGKDGKGKVPAFKRYKNQLKNADGVVPQSWWPYEFAGHTDAAKKEFKAIFQGEDKANHFDTPKPSTLIERILQLGSNANDIILDSFAGSGTTAHAVFNLNKQDDGNRKVILIEMEDYAETITAERVKRVIKGYGEGSKAVEGTGGSFDYYTLGLPLFDEYDHLNETVGVERIREYVWFSETRSTYDPTQQEGSYYLGKKDECAYYFFYEPDNLTELNYDFLATVQVKADQYVFYADNCLLPEEFMLARNIIFKKIPRDITRF